MSNDPKILLFMIDIMSDGYLAVSQTPRIHFHQKSLTISKLPWNFNPIPHTDRLYLPIEKKTFLNL